MSFDNKIKKIGTFATNLVVVGYTQKSLQKIVNWLKQKPNFCHCHSKIYLKTSFLKCRFFVCK